jgi:hypothetical protein
MELMQDFVDVNGGTLLPAVFLFLPVLSFFTMAFSPTVFSETLG